MWLLVEALLSNADQAYSIGKLPIIALPRGFD
jgi:hypothetical protein